MRVGILQCGSVATDLSPVFGDYPQMFQRLLSAVSPALEFRRYDLTAGFFPESLTACEGWLFTGSRWSVYDEEAWIRRAGELAARLHALGRPTVGICFGHQLIAAALGGRVEKAPQGWGVGVHTTHIQTQPEWMVPAPDRLSLLVSHQDQVIVPPPGTQWLTGNDFCRYGMTQIADHILTFQGHPEFSKDYSKALMKRRRSAIGEQAYRAGLASLALDVDDRMAAQWIVRFLQGV
ncbi:MAG: GMP synthase [Nitrococcus mobilis]|nr:GMP synthase [Nitrococcus mobilis]